MQLINNCQKLTDDRQLTWALKSYNTFDSDKYYLLNIHNLYFGHNTNVTATYDVPSQEQYSLLLMILKTCFPFRPYRTET